MTCFKKIDKTDKTDNFQSECRLQQVGQYFAEIIPLFKNNHSSTNRMKILIY